MKNVLMFLLGFFVGSTTILFFQIKGQRIREEQEEKLKKKKWKNNRGIKDINEKRQIFICLSFRNKPIIKDI